MKMTQHVIEQRELIEQKSLEAARAASAITQSMAELKKVQKEIMVHAHAIDKNANFKKTIKETEVHQENVDYNVTQCTKCSGAAGICHEDCVFGNGEDKIRCIAMDENGNCKVCPNKCSWSSHVNTNIAYRQKTVDKVIDVEALKKQFTDGT